MKDIDFDELDRAVSSVLGQTAAPGASSVGADGTTVSVNTEKSSIVSAKEPMTSDSQPASVSQPPPSAPSVSRARSLAVKRRGQFMDVMHPSADMNGAAQPSLEGNPRKSVQTITPLSEKVQPEPVEKKPIEPIVLVTEPSEPTADLDESASLIGAEPPVLEVIQETKDEVRTDDKAVSLEEDLKELDLDIQPQPTGDIPKDVSEEAVPAAPVSTGLLASVPQTTPFLADTKVDKRPLGGMPESDDTADDIDTQTAPVAPLPRELQPDVVEVESTLESQKPEPVAPFATHVEAAPDAKDGRVEGHPLFDTSTYHEPIAAVSGAGMPGWAKWLLGLLICLVIGAGVGYFLFAAGL